MSSLLSIPQAAALLKQGKVVAYPTEAIFGLGCCPQNEAALKHLLVLKQRSATKGMILIASEWSQLLPYVDLTAISQTRLNDIMQYWPGPYTFVFPASDKVLPLVKGQFTTVAVRVTAHPTARALCEAFGGALISTSANVSGLPPFKAADEIISQFQGDIAGVTEGSLGDALKPTTIMDALTGQVYR